VSSLAENARPLPRAARSENDPGAAPERRDSMELIAEAEALGVPWREILSREVLAEATLQRFLGAEIRDVPLWRLVSILPVTLLHCWRARDRIDRLCWEASTEGGRSARREVKALLNKLAGSRPRRAGERTMLARHYWFAYNRVLELQAVALAAERCRAASGDREEALCECTGAPRRDAAWAVARLTSPGRSYVLEDAMARAREEGFEIPRAESELKAFARLRRFVSRHDLRVRRLRRRRQARVFKRADGPARGSGI
jgi:hypothetical protein